MGSSFAAMTDTVLRIDRLRGTGEGAKARLALAVRHHYAGKLDKAAALYRLILASEPRHAEALYLLGLIAEQQGRDNQALRLFTKAAKCDPENPNYHCSAAGILRRVGRLAEAVESYRIATGLAPDSAPIHSALGDALVELGHHEDAAVSYSRAAELNHEQVNA